MKKLALLLAIILIFGLSVTAYATTPRLVNVMPEMTFSGTTANCAVAVTGDHATDEIDIVIKLWRGSTCIRTWYDNGEGYVFWDGTATVSKGKTYTLTVDVTINDVMKPRVSISGTC